MLKRILWLIFKWGFILVGSLAAFAAAVVLGIVIATYYFGIERNLFKLPDASALRELKPLEASFVYSAKDELIGCYAKEYRIVFLDEEIPELLKKAIIASEDQRFYWHFGVDPIAVARAAWVNFRAGRIVEGGSTLTQQVAKNWLLTPERTFDRKIKEALLAIRIEHELTKAEILTLYVNTAFLGRNSYGFEAGARSYFGKSLKDLKIEEFAYLVGLINNPSVSYPLRRKNQVLLLMRADGSLSDDEYSEAYYASIKLVSTKENCKNEAPYFVEEIRKAYKDKLPLLTGGLRIYTTLDKAIQKKAEEALKNGLRKYRARQPQNADKVQGAMIVLDTRTAEIRAMVGGEDFGKSEFNNATQAQRQPGSTFKPFADAAYLKYICTSDRKLCKFQDSPYAVSMGRGRELHYVENYPYTNLPRYRGFVNMDIQLAESRNAATMWMAGEVKALWVKQLEAKKREKIEMAIAAEFERRLTDIDSKEMSDNSRLRAKEKAIADLERKKKKFLAELSITPEESMQWLTDIARDAGIGSRLESYLVTAIGASEVNLLELTAAFIPFANGGYSVKPSMIRGIYDANFNLVTQANTLRPTPVFSKSLDPESIRENARIAENMKELLRGVVDLPTGTAHALRKTFPYGDIACKTGTATNTKKDGKAVPTDNWIVCLTPRYTVGVWIGLSDKEDLGNRETGAVNALPVLEEIMRDLNLVDPSEKFESLFVAPTDENPAEGVAEEPEKNPDEKASVEKEEQSKAPQE